MLKSNYFLPFILLIVFCFGYNPASNANNQWTQKSSFGNFGRHRAVAVGIGTKMYAGTGHLNGDGSDEWYSEWWEYDPATNAWSQKADYIGNNGNGDQDLIAIAIGGIAYVGLGYFSDEKHYKFNPITNTWTQLADAPSDNFSNTEPFVINGKGYFPERITHSLYEYDPVVDTWTLIGPMPTVVGHRYGTFAIGGKGYFKRGSLFYEFDAATYIWTQKANYPGIAPNNNLGISQNGYGYYVGGYLNWGEMYKEVWKYDPINDTWVQLPDYPFTSRRWAVKANIGERCFIGMGTNGTNFNDFWEFDEYAGVEEFKIEQFAAYPTLAEDYVNFTSENVSDFGITVFNLNGQKVASVLAKNGETILNRGTLSSGTYIYAVEIEGKTVHSDRFTFN